MFLWLWNMGIIWNFSTSCIIKSILWLWGHFILSKFHTFIVLKDITITCCNTRWNFKNGFSCEVPYWWESSKESSMIRFYSLCFDKEKRSRLGVILKPCGLIFGQSWSPSPLWTILLNKGHGLMWTFREHMV